MADSFEMPRYCARCGEIFDGRNARCTECDTEWPRELPQNLVSAYALLLTEIQQLRRRGEITEGMFAALRRIYETRLIAVRPARKPKPVPQPLPRPVFVAATAAPAAAAPPYSPPRPIAAPPRTPRPISPPRPPKPPSHVRQDLKQWAARRQADLVLYLGAFLLTISALIFVSYQGSGMSGLAKSGLFGAYTALFLVFGMQLRKWQRVQEAGPIFLALGAALAPLNFIALYTNVLRHEDVAREFVWLTGSVATATLYALFAWRGFGKGYWLPAAGSAFAAYASLGACLQLPHEWFGPWFMGLAVAENFIALRLPRFRGEAEGGAYALGIASLAFTHAWVGFEGGHHAALPAVHALALLGLCRSAFPSLRPLFIGALPVLATTTAATTAWAIDPWQAGALEWAPAWLLGLSAGYLFANRLKPELGALWASLSLVSGAAAVALAHGLVADGEIAWRLPVAYSLSASIAAAWFIERRYVPAIMLVPALLSATAATGLWAADALAFEWLGSFVIAAGIGYLVIARERADEALGWRMIAASCGALGLLISHAAAFAADTNAWQLVAAYGLLAAGAAFDALRLRAAAAISVLALAAGGAAALWAFEVTAAAWALPALSLALWVVATERLWTRDAALRTLAWPLVALLSLTPLMALDAYRSEQWFGAASFALTAVAMFAMAARSAGAFATLAGFATERAARWERHMLARLGGWALFAAGGYAANALHLTAIESAWAYGSVALGCGLAVTLLRSRVPSMDEILGPVALSGVAIAVAIALPDLGHASIIIGAAAVVAAIATGGRYVNIWRSGYASLGTLALLFAHTHAAAIGTDAWQLPVVYGLAFAALLWDSVRNRFQPAMLFVPAVAACGATALGWWLEWPLEHLAWAPLSFALGLAATERLWRRGELTRRAGWPYVIALGLTPTVFADAFMDAPWFGAAAFAVAAAAWAVTLVRSNGALAALFGLAGERETLVERQAIAAGAFALGLASLGFGALGFELAQHHAAWVFAGASLAAFAAILGLRSRFPALEDILGPASVLGVLAAVFASYPHHDHTALILGVTAVAAAVCTAGRFAPAWRGGYALAGVLALVFAHNHAEFAGRQAWELPTAYGLVLAALLWDSVRNRFQPAMLFVPLTAVAGATAFGWWQAWEVQHLAWAPLGMALAIAASERLWMRGELLRKAAWPYTLAFALAPVLLLETFHAEAGVGAAAFALAAIAWAAVAVRSNGAVSALFDLTTPGAVRGERQVLALGAFALGLVALGHANLALGVPLQDAAWTFAAIGAVAILATCTTRTPVRAWHGPLDIAGVTAFALGLAASWDHSGQLSAMLAAGAGALLASGLVNRSNGRVITVGILASASAGLTWVWADWPLWSLALSFAGAAMVLFGTLAPLRQKPHALRTAIRFFSVAPIILANGLAALATLNRFLADAFENAAPAVVTTPEWATLVAVLALGGWMFVFEAIIRRDRNYAFAGSGVLLLALELGLAMLQIDNIQVHTVPIALYLIGAGLTFRRSDPLFGAHMFVHEALFVMGAGLLAIPAAVESFAPGGGTWGLVVIAQGLAILALGLVMVQRWLAVSGIVTLVGVAGRFVFDSTSSGSVPYWLILGVAGLALLGVGVLMLLERDWWDRTRGHIVRWWLEGEAEPPVVSR